MRLLIGIAVFFVWSAGSGYWYVCKIKGLCPEDQPATRIASELGPRESAGTREVVDTLPPPPPAPIVIPAALEGTQSLLFTFARPILKNRDDVTDYVEKAAEFLLSSPNHKVAITGYTDDTAARHNNLELGMRRAEVVAEMFRKAGVSDAQMVIESKGEQDPVASNMTRAGREKNRRVEIGLLELE